MSAIRVISREYDIDIINLLFVWLHILIIWSCQHLNIFCKNKSLKSLDLAARGTLVIVQKPLYCTGWVLLSSLVWRWLHSLTTELLLAQWRPVSCTVGSDRVAAKCSRPDWSSQQFQSEIQLRVNWCVERKGEEKAEKERKGKGRGNEMGKG